jgi:hypothetical protein
VLLILNIGKFYLRLFALSETYRCNQFTLSYGDNTARGNLLLFVQHGAIKMTDTKSGLATPVMMAKKTALTCIFLKPSTMREIRQENCHQFREV